MANASFAYCTDHVSVRPRLISENYGGVVTHPLYPFPYYYKYNMTIVQKLVWCHPMQDTTRCPTTMQSKPESSKPYRALKKRTNAYLGVDGLWRQSKLNAMSCCEGGVPTLMTLVQDKFLGGPPSTWARGRRCSVVLRYFNQDRTIRRIR
eukprot:scaffold34650_cov219-Amphora_coffeaeformis.AAC.5